MQFAAWGIKDYAVCSLGIQGYAAGCSLGYPGLQWYAAVEVTSLEPAGGQCTHSFLLELRVRSMLHHQEAAVESICHRAVVIWPGCRRDHRVAVN
jgi:hypothetical protein